VGLTLHLMHLPVRAVAWLPLLLEHPPAALLLLLLLPGGSAAPQ
jgi:hypothetical protein